jgi:hypothetical protein
MSKYVEKRQVRAILIHGWSLQLGLNEDNRKQGSYFIVLN